MLCCSSKNIIRASYASGRGQLLKYFNIVVSYSSFFCHEAFHLPCIFKFGNDIGTPMGHSSGMSELLSIATIRRPCQQFLQNVVGYVLCLEQLVLELGQSVSFSVSAQKLKYNLNPKLVLASPESPQSTVCNLCSVHTSIKICSIRREREK